MENLKQATGEIWPPKFVSGILWAIAVQLKFTIPSFFRTSVSRRTLFDFRSSYKHCYFSRVCLATRQNGFQTVIKVCFVFQYRSEAISAGLAILS